MEQQENFLQLLEQAKSKDLGKIRTNISINKWIKIRLGDTFRFLVNHNIRHIVQIKISFQAAPLLIRPVRFYQLPITNNSTNLFY
ncbi:DinB family protein [Sphingobacterium sp. E70]|uniref:DinB family protein n=1 Tax=Sphingobacterium sp. E70 TaxID=2853439 RepID=UPI00211CF3EC|nr:DinB family protein [Sphingobacterium sp. E70]ULT24221.1 DinB family protein [Sphingobacterium sp. E70]